MSRQDSDNSADELSVPGSAGAASPISLPAEGEAISPSSPPAEGEAASQNGLPIKADAASLPTHSALAQNAEESVEKAQNAATNVAVKNADASVLLDFPVTDDATSLPETVPSKFPLAAVEPPGKGISHADNDEDEAEDDGRVMSVIDHLDELRTRLIRALAIFAVAMGVAFTFGKNIIAFLEVPGKGMTFQALSIEEPVLVYFKVSFYAAIILAAPFILYEISAFVAPGLKKNERKILAPIIVGGPLLFVTGAAFAYYFVLPPMLFFFNSFSATIAPIQQRLDYYVSLVTSMLFYMGICFQLPIVLFALAIAGIINSRQLLSVWRYAVVGASVVAAVITPDPTVISMLIVLAALVALYFFTVLLLRLFGR